MSSQSTSPKVAIQSNLEWSYFLTLILLVIHQIDAAYWHEWEMFHLPGGIQGYLVFNVIAISILIFGYGRVTQLERPSGILFAKICANLGVITFVIHASFAFAGFVQFHLPFSITIIGLCLPSALWQFVEIRRYVQGHKD